jgi:hypothetical protein
MPPEAPAPAITQLTVTLLKKHPDENTEFVICNSNSTRWGSAQKFTFAAPAGTHKIGQHVQVSFEIEHNKENQE